MEAEKWIEYNGGRKREEDRRWKSWEGKWGKESSRKLREETRGLCREER